MSDSTPSAQPNTNIAPVPQTPPQTKMVARGVWFDSSAAIRDIRILHRDKQRIEAKISGDAVVPSDEFNDIFQMFFGSDAANRDKRPIEVKPTGAAFRSPDWTSPNLLGIMPPQYEVGNFYYVQISSSAERGTYRDIETYFNTYEEAIYTANKVTKKRIIWFPTDKLQPDLDSIIVSITKKSLIVFCKMHGWTPYFIDLNFSAMREYGYTWAKQNRIMSQVSDYTDNEIVQKRSIMFAILAFFGPRRSTLWSGGFSAGSSPHGPYKE